jgi:potassium voltage-gated channel Eag-related subfamily H protein 5
MLEANSLVLKGCRLFADHFSPQFKKKTLKIIRSLTLYPDISLESQLNDDRDNFLFFIESGQIRVEYGANANGQQNPKMTSIALLAEGQHFGLEGFITGLPSWETYKSIGFTQLLYIQRSEFMAILREYPDDYEQFCNLKDSAHDLVTCYSCHSKKHSVQHCPMVHYVPD